MKSHWEEILKVRAYDVDSNNRLKIILKLKPGRKGSINYMLFEILFYIMKKMKSMVKQLQPGFL